MNLEAALVCVTTKTLSLLQLPDSDPSATTWLSEISPLVIKLKSCVEVLCNRAKSALTILTIEVRLMTPGGIGFTQIIPSLPLPHLPPPHRHQTKGIIITSNSIRILN